MQMAAVKVPAEDRPTIPITAVTLPVGHQDGGVPAAGTPETVTATSAGWDTPTPGSGPGGPAGAPEQPAARRRLRRVLLAGGVAVAVLVATGGATAGYAYAGEVPRGTSVLGVDLGGKSRTEAVRVLRADLASRASTFTTPVQVRIGDQTGEVLPAAVGLAVDVEATVTAAAAHRPGPFSLLFGSRTAEPVVTVDAEKLDAELRKIVGRTGQQMRLPAITFSGTTPRPVYPKPSKGLRAEESAKALREGWLRGQPVQVPLVETHPATTTEEVDKLVTELARPAVAGPVTVTTDRGNFTIPPAAIAKSLVLTADKTGKIAPRVDEKKLRTALPGQLDKVEVKPKDATMSIQGNKPKIVAGAGGSQVDTAALARDLLAVLPKPDGRTVRAQLKPVEPKVSAADLTNMGIKERVSTFTTNFTGGLGSPRSQNIVTIARDVDGTVVKPGETFSLNGHTGERGYAQGYRDAPVILDGKLVPGVGGGTSQFTTTLFNATYYAGLEDVEHKPHSYWFSRYPPVIESTIFWPDLDFKFKNDTPHGVLIDTSHTSSSITVSIWSTKVYDKVTTEWSPRRNITTPKVIKLQPGPSCIPTNGINGFTQDAFRLFHKGGKVVKREKFTWKYLAEPRYSCG
ncbi:VanW family protein [Plantactinospora sp. KLBMP9567]|uniref:VanW family protein n=1 Tax=Plantactinospora sp. KLBMP9567 TaxID=3085900 RepID=UPI00298158A1|nr:VanW family protein [Plantactinospora sp. KLBMP9567]MDW5325668.1 VanW family protein [Plantactinospora sp. KLBMP9567]